MASISSLRGMDRRAWNAVLAAVLGWTLDAFDFLLMVFMFSAIAKEFHADIAKVAAASVLTLAARPFGALAFGMLADRFGRRPVLVADILAYSVIEFASAFAPSLGALLILRAAFGFAMGGEWGVGASLAMESVPPRARGFISGLLQQGYALGYLLAAVIYYFLFDKIGWRGMFMVGVAPALIILLLRGGVAESPAFEKLRAARKTPQAPSRWTARSAPLAALTLGGLLLAIAPAVIGANGAGALWWIYLIDAPVALIGLLLIFRANWRTALWAAALMAAFNLFSHGSQDLYPTFLQRGRHLSTHVVGALAILMNFGAIAGGLAFGAWSERAGRKVAIITAAVASLVLIPLWAFSPSLAMLAAGAFFMQAMVQGAWGVVPAHLNELSPPASRGAFPGYVYQLGNLLASGCAVWQARLAEARGGDWSLALAVATGAAAIAIVLFTLLGRERRGAALGEPDRLAAADGPVGRAGLLGDHLA